MYKNIGEREVRFAEEDLEKAKLKKRLTEAVTRWVEKIKNPKLEITSMECLESGAATEATVKQDKAKKYVAKSGSDHAVAMFKLRDGRELKAKIFGNEEEPGYAKGAAAILSGLEREGENFFPKIVGWIDHRGNKSETAGDVLISEVAHGESLSEILRKIGKNPEKIAEAKDIFSHLGELLGKIHGRSEEYKEPGNFTEEDRWDRKRIEEDMSLLPEIIDMEQLPIEKAKEILEKLSNSGYVSWIHGDAHLDNFFNDMENKSISIVDYKSLRKGDPMADLSRVVASVRSWRGRSDFDQKVENDLIKSFIIGYRKERKEEPEKPKKFDYAKVIAYELRLYLLELKQFIRLRQKIQKHIGDGKRFSNERDFNMACLKKKVKVRDLRSMDLSEEDILVFKYFLNVLRNISDCVIYLGRMEV